MRRSLAAHLIPIALLFASSSTAVFAPSSVLASVEDAKDQGRVSGVVRALDNKPIESALVILNCDSGPPRDTVTNSRGQFRFLSVPVGGCTVHVFAGQADASKHIAVAAGAKLRVDFEVDPKSEFKRTIRAVRQSSDAGSMVPTSAGSSRDFHSVVTSSAIGSRDSAGISLAGSTSVANETFNTEGYAHIASNSFITALDRPLSTFAADVDTASYSNVRRFITQGRLPPPDAVRIEELVNYFDYSSYVVPRGDTPVTVNWEIATCPWNTSRLLARIGLQTQPIAADQTPPRNLVFLLDVSGSMASPDKLPLLKRALQLLVDNLRRKDRVSIVVYAGAAGVVLPPTSGKHLPAIRDAIASLESGGSTNGGAGIELAYKLARKSFVRRGINRVILATDGDFNIGTTSDGDLVRLIERQRNKGVFLSVLGFGQGNLQDAKMEQLADKGNGNYAYIDSLAEARKVLVDQAGATLMTVAKDVKLQVEFNPMKVASYRLIGYENRLLADADFADDTKDAGDMGAGHSVTALYELVPAKNGSRTAKSKAHKLRYQQTREPSSVAQSHEWMTVAVRYKTPDSQKSRLLEVPMAGRPKSLETASKDLLFAAAVAAYGMELRDSKERGKTSLSMVRALAKGALGPDRKGYRAAFIALVDDTIRLHKGSQR